MKAIKTAVSLPAETYRRAERLRKKLGKSRSELMADALAELIRRTETRQKEERDAAAYAAAPETGAEAAAVMKNLSRAWRRLDDDDDWSDLAPK